MAGEEHLKIVQLSKKEDGLWNVHSPSYRNKEMQSVALHNICDNMNIDSLNAKDVKNKIKTLRSTYYLECDKINKSSTAGSEKKGLSFKNKVVPRITWLHKRCSNKKKKIVSKQQVKIHTVYQAIIVHNSDFFFTFDRLFLPLLINGIIIIFSYISRTTLVILKMLIVRLTFIRRRFQFKIPIAGQKSTSIFGKTNDRE